MIPVEKALKTILVNFQPLGLETVHLLKARGRVIGENIMSPRNIPSADNSAMDGYAVRCADTRGAGKTTPVKLKIIEDIPAGKFPRKNIGKNETARIMTGAVIPQGADAVIRQEDTRKDGRTVIIFASAARGENIRFAGEDVRKGESVIPKNSLLRPAHIGMLAALGKSSLRVYQKPRVAIMSTGDELVNIKTNPPPGQNSQQQQLFAGSASTGMRRDTDHPRNCQR